MALQDLSSNLANATKASDQVQGFLLSFLVFEVS